jgi:hypothetical protein
MRFLPLLAIPFLAIASTALAQSVLLPAPRLLTTMPMGARVGSTVEVVVTSEEGAGCTDLVFSSPKITATPKKDEKGEVEPNRFLVTIAPDAQPGIVEARLFTKLGMSSARAFSINHFDEITRKAANTSLDKALPLPPNTICNATTTTKAVDFYRFEAAKGQHFVLECATTGIDSKLTPVVIVADDKGRDLVAERRTGHLEFTAPSDGTYHVKVHGLTFQGGPEHFYRLALMLPPNAATPAPRQPSTRSVSSATLPLPEHIPSNTLNEQEPNNLAANAQSITPPCTIHGAFATAGDVDTYDFQGKKGEIWWIEAVSERNGLPTDPFILVQKVKPDGSTEDVAEINDIASPVKLSSNGYAYDGPPYDIGSADPLGKLEVKEDGHYRIQIRDLFGGTRAVPRHTYSLIIRKPAPDFAVAAWALHKELRNGDRAAVSKPIALRGGATMPFEVIAVRRDGFDGPIELSVDNLPPGVTATGLRIPQGKSVGSILFTAAADAPRGVSLARITASAKIGDQQVTRQCPTASMVWPVRDASAETPSPRLIADTPVSVGGEELTPLTIAPAENNPFEVDAAGKLVIPLKLTWRGEFSGGSIKMTALGQDISAIKPFDIPTKAAESKIELDLASLKLAPGEYTFAIHGGVVAKYPSAPKLPSAAAPQPEPKAAEATGKVAAKPAEAPKDIVDIVTSEPIRIKINPAKK